MNVNNIKESNLQAAPNSAYIPTAEGTASYVYGDSHPRKRQDAYYFRPGKLCELQKTQAMVVADSDCSTRDI